MTKLKLLFVVLLAVGALGRRVDGADAPAAQLPDSEELIGIFKADQADRGPPHGQEADWKAVARRDGARLRRVKELYAANQLQTGKDYLRAALILQHADQAEDHLLAHEFCVAALAKGETGARWLAAATEDRFLLAIGRRQRFGTQYESKGKGPRRLSALEAGVTDTLRRELGVPPLAEAKRREEKR